MTKIELLERQHLIAVARAKAAINMLKMIDRIRHEAEEEVNQLSATVTETYTNWREAVERRKNAPH